MAKDEALSDPNGDFQDLLVTAAYDYITEHGLPTSPEAMAWIANPNFEDVLEKYVAQSGGFTVDDWLQMIVNIEDVTVSKSGRGIHVTFNFDFDGGDNSPGEGNRTAYGSL